MPLPAESGLPKHVVDKQTRCVYGTRDAGMVWKQCYRDALETSALPAACQIQVCVDHPESDISIVVHGVGVTAMCTDMDLD